MTDQMLYGICLVCGRSHAPENRQRLIRPMVGELQTRHIRAAWPCFYPRDDAAAERRLFRDIAAVRAGSADREAA